MANTSTVILVPFLFAFLGYTGRFYVKENAAAKLSASFLLALVTVAIVIAYLALGVSDNLPQYGTIGFGVVGLALLALSVFRMFML